MQDEILPDSMVLPLMETHGIDREEATKRLTLLMNSGIFPVDINDPEALSLVDDFLSRDSETLAESVMFEKFLTVCLNDKDLVAEYDRLSGTNITEVMRLANDGIEAENMEDQLTQFTQFVASTLFPAYLSTLNETDDQ